MTLDLQEIVGDWPLQAAEPVARLVAVRKSASYVQLRIDMGLLQMRLNGRPDGNRYHGMPTVQDHINHELRIVGTPIADADWHELVRELNQVNYRRLALAELADDALARDTQPLAIRMLTGAIRDASFSRASVALLESASEDRLTVSDALLLPTLLFSQARLTAQLRVLQDRVHEAIDAVEEGIIALGAALDELGVEEDTDEDGSDSTGLISLRNFSQQLRATYETPRTLREQLADAIEKEDFTEAAKVREAMAAIVETAPADEFAFTTEI